MSKLKKGSSCQPINGWHKCWDIPTPIAHTLLTYFYLRSVLLLRNPWCVYSLSLSAYDRSRMVHAVSWCMGMTASIQGTLLLRWEFIELQFKPFFWPCLWLWTDLSSSHAWADPGMSHIIQVLRAQGLGSVVVHEASHNKDSMLDKSFCSCSNTLGISGYSSLSYEAAKIQSIASPEFLKLT